MDYREALQAAYDRLADTHDEDPRQPLMRSIAALLAQPDGVPTGTLELSAMVAPGGKFTVIDQHGRQVANVRSVAVFIDGGVPIFQVNM